MTATKQSDKMKAVFKNNAAKSKGEAATLSAEEERNYIIADLESEVRNLEALRAGSGKSKLPKDITFAEYVKERWGFAPAENGTPESFLLALGLEPNETTVQSLFNFPDAAGMRWLVPEIFREAIRLGLNKAPIYPSLIVREEMVESPTVQMPYIKRSAAVMSKISEGGNFPFGTLAFDQKEVKCQKVGVGLNVTYEVLQYVKLNMVTTFLQDVGIQLGAQLDALAVSILINGDQSSGSMSAPVIGVTTAGTIAYRDLLRVWFRMGRLGRMPVGMLTGEDMGINIAEISELKALAGVATLKQLRLATPVPTAQDLWIHGGMPTDQVMLIDNSSALIKLTSAPLMVESEKIISKQIETTVVSLTTTFANLVRDSRVIIDKSLLIGANPFPAYMSVDAYEQKQFNS